MEGRIHVAVFMNQKGISVERGKADRAGHGIFHMVVVVVVVVCIMRTPEQISKKPIGPFVACSKYIIRVSCVPRRSSNAATKRFTPFQTRCSASPARQPNGKQTERKEETGRKREREGKEAEEPFPVEIYAAGNSAIKQRYAIYLSR